MCVQREFPPSPTFDFEVHASEHERPDELGLHLPLEVDEDGGQVAVGVVGDAGGGDGLEELGLRELPGQRAQVLVDEGAQRDAGRSHRPVSEGPTQSNRSLTLSLSDYTN